MAAPLTDVITSLDGDAYAEGRSGSWGLEGPEHVAWLGEHPAGTVVMGATTDQRVSGTAAGENPTGEVELDATGRHTVDGLTAAPKVVSGRRSTSRCRGRTRPWCAAARCPSAAQSRSTRPPRCSGEETSV